MVSHAEQKHMRIIVSHPLLARLFRDSLALVEAVRELLVVLVRGVVGQHLLARGALEGLEAGLALDGLRGGVLVTRLVQFVLRDYSH